MADFFDITKRGTVSYRAGEVFGVVDCHNNLMAFSESLSPKKDRYGAVVEHENDINFSPIDHNAAYEKLCSEGERKCDFFLHTDSRRTLVFVELKDRYTSEYLNSEELKSFLDLNPKNSNSDVAADVWVDDVIEQLTHTIRKFEKLNPTDINQYPNVHLAYGANKKVAYGVDFQVVNKKEDFYMDTQFQLILSNLIKVPSDPPAKPSIVLSLDELKSMTR